MRVFVVEESPALSARLLERLAVVPMLAVVGVARSVTEAIRVIPTLEPDLVITDTEVADGGGLALLHVLQARRAVARTGPRVLLWTGCEDPRRRAVAQGLGAEARFDKTREVDQLVEYCRRAAARRA
jgi:two-component system, NarL family, nitrate/nitrite response regulator NarL